MRRVLIIVCASFFIGLLTTVGVAWACAAWVNPMLGDTSYPARQLATGGWELCSTYSNIGHTRINCVVGPATNSNDGAHFIARYVEFPDGSTTGLLKVIGTELRSGWPLNAFSCLNPDEINFRPQTRSGLSGFGGLGGLGGVSSYRAGQGRIEGGIKLQPWRAGGSMSWRALPYQPIWRGLILNTFLYAVVWFILIFGPLVIRKIWRRHHQQCVRCGYDLRGAEHTLCPECGVTVS